MARGYVYTISIQAWFGQHLTLDRFIRALLIPSENTIRVSMEEWIGPLGPGFVYDEMIGSGFFRKVPSGFW